MGNSCFKTLSIAELLEMTSDRNFCELVQCEHGKLMKTQLKGTIACFSRQENTNKNKYSDIPCWDHSRVIINSSESGESVNCDGKNRDSSQVLTSEQIASTYIHANYVDGLGVAKKFICTQTPMEHTWEDFWQMLCEQKSRVIVSLTNTHRDDLQSYQHWAYPEGSEMTFGRYVIKILKTKEEISFTQTQLLVTDVNTDTSQEITNFWFSNRSDNNILTDPKDFLSLLRQVNREQYSVVKETENTSRPAGPILVHCSTGIDLSAIFCTIDNALTQLRKQKKVSLPKTVLKIRAQRHSSVSTTEQYAFCYKVLEHFLREEAKRESAELLPHDKRFAVYVPECRRKELKITTTKGKNYSDSD